MSKYVFYKLGNPKTSVFVDTKTGLKVTKTLPGKLIKVATRGSKKITIAVQNKHLEEIPESEYNKLKAEYDANIAKAKDSSKQSTKVSTQKEETPEQKKEKLIALKKKEFGDMNKDQLYTYYKDNFEVEKDELEAFKGLNKAEMVDALVEAETESE